jgi:hypothetical protein
MDRPRGLSSAVFALDGSETCSERFWFVARWPKSAGRTLHLVGVVEELSFSRTAPQMIRAELRAAVATAEGEQRHALEQALAAARAVLPPGKPKDTVTSDDPVTEILRIAAEYAPT